MGQCFVARGAPLARRPTLPPRSDGVSPPAGGDAVYEWRRNPSRLRSSYFQMDTYSEGKRSYNCFPKVSSLLKMATNCAKYRHSSYQYWQFCLQTPSQTKHPASTTISPHDLHSPPTASSHAAEHSSNQYIEMRRDLG